jgi:hypothetical protein
MASLARLWQRLLHALHVRPIGAPHWIEPSSPVTRAVYAAGPLLTMSAWDEPADDFAPAAQQSQPADASPEPAREEGTPKRPGVAA